MKKLFDLFIAFLKPGVFGFGGGQAAIPLIEVEVVDNYKWLTTDQFSDFLAMGNTLPGPIATKMSIVIGYNVAGPLGAIVALLGMILPSSIAIVVLLQLFFQFKDTAFVKGMQVAAKPVVVVLIASVAISMARSSVFNNFSLGSSKTIIVLSIFVISAIVLILNETLAGFNIHPAILMVVVLLFGGLFIR